MKIQLGDTKYEYSHFDEYEEDNVKRFHFIKVDSGEELHLDLSPYNKTPAYRTIEVCCLFHSKFGRLPSRRDVDSRGPLQEHSLFEKNTDTDIDGILQKFLYEEVA